MPEAVLLLIRRVQAAIVSDALTLFVDIGKWPVQFQNGSFVRRPGAQKAPATECD